MYTKFGKSANIGTSNFGITRNEFSIFGKIKLETDQNSETI